MQRFAVRVAISIHAPRTGSDRKQVARELGLSISIHAPRTGSDCTAHCSTARRTDFNPRSPHGERRGRCTPGFGGKDFNPRSPHGERLLLRRCDCPPMGFQSTLPARGATSRPATANSRRIFQSTLPARGATPPADSHTAGAVDFNPRSPHGERPNGRIWRTLLADFNPRSPHGERPSSGRPRWRTSRYFNPRSPHGERHLRLCAVRPADYFNPRSPHGERRGNRT